MSCVLLNAFAMYLNVLLCQFVLLARTANSSAGMAPNHKDFAKHKSIVQPGRATAGIEYLVLPNHGKSNRAKKDGQQFAVAVATPSIMRRPAASLTVKPDTHYTYPYRTAVQKQFVVNKCCAAVSWTVGDGKPIYMVEFARGPSRGEFGDVYINLGRLYIGDGDEKSPTILQERVE